MFQNLRRGTYGQYLKPLLAYIDIVIVNLCLLAVILLNPEMPLDVSKRMLFVLANLSYLPTLLLLRSEHEQRALIMDHVVLRALQLVVIYAISFIVLLTFLRISFPEKLYIEYFVLLGIAQPLWWLVSRYLIKRYRRKGYNYTRVVIIGTNEMSTRLAEELDADAGFGYRLLGFFDNECPKDFKGKYLGGIDRLEDYVRTYHVDQIFYTLPGNMQSNIMDVVAIADNHVAQFYYVPQINRRVCRNFQLNSIGSLPVLSIRRNPLKSPINNAVKRLFDIGFSSLVLLASPIVFIPVAIAIKLSSPGPILFKQKRTGYRGEPFNCLKFRTMRVNAKADTQQATKDDPRKTRVGNLLRKTSIDELPQFINVLLGDMSVVGPRPHMLKHTDEYASLVDKYMVRHAVKPGITGWAQVNGYRGITDQLWKMERRVEHDVWYIEHWSLLLDMKIVVRTVLNAIEGEKNAF